MNAIPGSNGKATLAFPATSLPLPTGYAMIDSTPIVSAIN